jgi:hypothetical protein
MSAVRGTLYPPPLKCRFGDLLLFETISICPLVTLRDRGGSLSSLSWSTWTAVYDVTYRLQDGPSRPDHHHQPQDAAQLIRAFLLVTERAWLCNKRAAAYRVLPSCLCY